jgi:hypothetical protein
LKTFSQPVAGKSAAQQTLQEPQRDIHTILTIFESIVRTAERMPRRVRSAAAMRCENPLLEGGYRLVSFICFAISASSILAGRSLGSVQFLKRCGMTA